MGQNLIAEVPDKGDARSTGHAVMTSTSCLWKWIVPLSQ